MQEENSVKSHSAGGDVLSLSLSEKEQNIQKLLEEKAELENKLRYEIDEKNKLLSLNYALQTEVIQEFSELRSNLQDLMKKFTQLIAVEIGAIQGDKIHLGHNVWIKKSRYDAISEKPRMTPSWFVKKIAVEVFGMEVLRSSTVTGREKNRFPETKTPLKLDPIKIKAIKEITHFWIINVLKEDEDFAQKEKSKVTTYISQKTASLKKKDKTVQEGMAVGSTWREIDTEEEEEEENAQVDQNLSDYLSDDDYSVEKMDDSSSDIGEISPLFKKLRVQDDKDNESVKSNANDNV